MDIPFQITLRAARVNKGLLVKEVAEAVGRCPETISKYENDSTSIPRDLLSDLVKLYGIPEAYLYFGKESVITEFKKKRKRRTA